MTPDILAEIEAEYPVITPCPFCGGVSSPNSNWNSVWVNCDECGAKGPVFTKMMFDPKPAYIAAIKAWERRV